jgi:hypothetical protein
MEEARLPSMLAAAYVHLTDDTMLGVVYGLLQQTQRVEGAIKGRPPAVCKPQRAFDAQLRYRTGNRTIGKRIHP